MIGLTALLKEDATFTMPPSPSWYLGREAINLFLTTVIFVGEEPNQWRLQPAQANAQPAFGLYKYNPETGLHQAFSFQVLTLAGDQIAGVTNFLNPILFSHFGLPSELAG